MTARTYLRQSAIPPTVAALLKTLHEAGFSAYPVGGCVRDLLLIALKLWRKSPSKTEKFSSKRAGRNTNIFRR